MQILWSNSFAWGATCAKCKGGNHFASKCNSKVHSMREESEESEESDIEYITSITDQPEVVHAMKKEESTLKWLLHRNP